MQVFTHLLRKPRGWSGWRCLLLFVLFSLGGATFGMAEECIPFAMIMVPFVIALGYDSIVAVTVTYVASQVGNAASWMSPFSVAVAQGIAGIPVLSGATFRLIMWVLVTLGAAAFMMVYAERIRKHPDKSVVYGGDAYFRERLDAVTEEEKEFKSGPQAGAFGNAGSAYLDHLGRDSERFLYSGDCFPVFCYGICGRCDSYYL